MPKYVLALNETVHYLAVTIEAKDLDEAENLLLEMYDKGDLYAVNSGYNIVELEANYNE